MLVVVVVQAVYQAVLVVQLQMAVVQVLVQLLAQQLQELPIVVVAVAEDVVQMVHLFQLVVQELLSSDTKKPRKGFYFKYIK